MDVELCWMNGCIAVLDDPMKRIIGCIALRLGGLIKLLDNWMKCIVR